MCVVDSYLSTILGFICVQQLQIVRHIGSIATIMPIPKSKPASKIKVKSASIQAQAIGLRCVMGLELEG